jgi:dolichyl-diphosphooligosaccharide--protein glycosyltransferase
MIKIRDKKGKTERDEGKKHLKERVKGGAAKVRSPKGLARSYWYVILLVIIVCIAFWARSFPARAGELQALDPFYIYSVSEYLVNHNLQMPEFDSMRYYPFGVVPMEVNSLGSVYIPAIIYLFLSFFGLNMHYLHFAIIFPALMGALSVFVMFFLGRELFRSNVAGLFSAFFLAMTPAFITRTSAGFFEKEPTGAPFMVISVYLFLKAYRQGSWKYGILSGISLALGTMTWGGISYVYLIFMLFGGLLLLSYSALVVGDYMFGNLGKIVSEIEDFMGYRLLASYGLMIVVAVLAQSPFPNTMGFLHNMVLPNIIIIAILAGKLLIERYGVLAKENQRYFVPAALLCGVLFVLFGSMFSDRLLGMINSFASYASLQKSVIGTTVAEQAPGDWGQIASTLGAGFSASALPLLSSVAGWLALWVFMWLGLFVMAYEFLRARNWLLLLPLMWLISSVWGVFFYIRLIFMLGLPAALMAAFLFCWAARRFRNRFQRTGLWYGLGIAAVAIVALTVTVNVANAYVYSQGLGPSICFQWGEEPCLTIEENGSLTLKADEPWYQAFNYMKNNMPENAVILSWWDFGYWFQERGERASMADGGNLGGIYGERDYHIADWYTSPPSEWDGNNNTLLYYFPYLRGNVSPIYILMDYTLPGKYGAISKIASRGEQVVGYLQFSQSGIRPTENGTIYEFVYGPYSIWMPFSDDGTRITGSPIFLVSQDGKYYSRQYINDICTNTGTVRVGESTPEMPGCVAISDLGIFYVPPEAENTIFNSLMFMDGTGLPVEKVFDNALVKIYRVNEEY